MEKEQASEQHSSGHRTLNAGWLAAGAAVAALSGAALFNRWRSRRAEADNPPAGRFIEIDGTTLHYTDQGSGPTVILLHGNGVTLQDWEASGVAGLARERFRVIAFDRPGFGYSSRPRSTVWTPAAQGDLVHRAMGRLGIERPVVVGHSWGTLVAVAMALNHPASVAGLVLVSGYYFGTGRPDVLLASPPALPVIGDTMAHTVSPLAGRLALPAGIKASFAPAPVDPRFSESMRGMMLRPSQIRATAADTALMIPAAVALSSRYRELDLPIKILAGEGDLITHMDEHSGRLGDTLKGAKLQRFAGLGHMLHYSRPEAVVNSVAGILQLP